MYFDTTPEDSKAIAQVVKDLFNGPALDLNNLPSNNELVRVVVADLATYFPRRWGGMHIPKSKTPNQSFKPIKAISDSIRYNKN